MLVKATTVDIFRALDVENVFVSARKEQIFHIPLSGDRELQVCTFPYPLRSRLLVSEEHRRKPLREQEEFLRAQVAQDLAQLAGQVDRDVPAVLVGHMMVLGAEFGSEQRMFLGSELEALIGAVAHPAYDAVLLGHVHRAQALRSEGPPVLYAGSLERVDFGDEGLEKGFYVVDIEEGPAGQRKVGYRFVPVTARPFLTLEVDALKGEPMERVLKTIEKARQEGKLEDAVLRVHLKVRQEDAALVDVPALRRALSDAFFVAAIAVNVDRPERVAFRGALDQLDPLEALERYWIARGVSAKRREVLTRYAQELIEGEE
jgi:exonuclease SbcD